MAIAWEVVRNLWNAYGAGHFWLSSLIAACVGMTGGVLLWWVVGFVSYWTPSLAGKPEAKSVIRQTTGNVSGGSTVNQAAGNITVNQGVSETTLRAVINEKAIAAFAQLMERYSHGFVIVGVSNTGKIVHESHLRDIQLEIDWDTAAAEIGGIEAKITWPSMTYTNPATGVYDMHFAGNQERIDFEENVPRRIQMTNMIPLYFEVLDAKKKVFIVGIK